MSDTIKRVLRGLVQLCAMAGLVLLDQHLKNVAAQTLKAGDTVVLIPGFLGLHYTENTGAAFSLFSSSTQTLSIVTLIALGAALVALFTVKKKALIYDICVPLIIAGGGSNLLDRFTRGYVIDYIRTLFVDFPIFNFADSLITCACFALIIYLIVEMVRENKKRKMPPAEPYGGSDVDVDELARKNAEASGDE